MCSINNPFRIWDTPQTWDMKLMLLSPTNILRLVRYEIAIRISLLEKGLR